MLKSITKNVSLLSVAATLFITACKKDNTISTADHQLIKIEQDVNNFSTITYNSNGSVATITGKDAGVAQSIALTYDANRKVSSVTVPAGVFKFTYGADGLASKTDFLAVGGNVVTAYINFTNQAGKLTELKSYLKNTFADVPSVKATYVYFANGDVQIQKIYIWNVLTNQYDLSETHVFEYDNKINPLALPTEALQTFFEVASAHNVTKETLFDDTNTLSATNNYTYVYDSKGYPTLQTETKVIPGNANLITTQVKYTYNN